MMRIVFVVPAVNMSGGIRTLATYAQGLQGRGHRVTVVSAAPEPRARRDRLAALLGLGGARPDRASHFDGTGVDHRPAPHWGPVTESDVPDADLVVATWWETAEAVARFGPAKGVKVLFAQGHDAETPGVPSARAEAVWRLPFQRIVVSQWLADLVRARYGASATVVPNGVDAHRFDAPPRGRQERPTLGLVYSPMQMKGCDLAAAAVARAAARIPGLRLLAFGSEPVDPAMPLPPGAEFLLRPDQDRLPALYASCDGWLWPSRREGFGLPILEAMACRTPVVACPAGASRELLAGGGGILLSEPGAAAMEEAIVRLLALTEPEWRAVSDRARATALGTTWADSVAGFEAALKAAAGAP